MDVIALVGASGTGKSHRAVALAHHYNVEAIIDDGLLIIGSAIVAGNSAKRQPTKIGAIKTALFTDTEHAAEVVNAIKENNISRILILGTSRAMVNRITGNLGLVRPGKYVEIAEVATAEEINQALNTRKLQGKHIVPAPTVAVKPRLSGTIIEPVRTLFQKKHGPHPQDRKLWVDQSVVKPTFSYFGRFYIANQVLSQIITHTAEALDHVEKVGKIQVLPSEDGVEFNVDLTVLFTSYIPDVARQVQSAIIEAVEHITALHVIAVNITVKRLIVSE